MPPRPPSRRPLKDTPAPDYNERLVSRETYAGFGKRMRAWRFAHGVTQEQMRQLMAEHAGIDAGANNSISRLEMGTAWPLPYWIDAMARLDLAVGEGRGRIYWGWGELVDSTLAKRPGPPLEIEEAPLEVVRVRPTPKRRAR